LEATLILFVIGALTLVVLIYWLLKGKRGALQAVIFTAFLLYGTQLTRTVDPGNPVAVFLLGAGAAGVAFLVTWLLSWLVDTVRRRRKSRMRINVAQMPGIPRHGWKTRRSDLHRNFWTCILGLSLWGGTSRHNQGFYISIAIVLLLAFALHGLRRIIGSNPIIRTGALDSAVALIRLSGLRLRRMLCWQDDIEQLPDQSQRVHLIITPLWRVGSP
jgi:hypothetical protein